MLSSRSRVIQGNVAGASMLAMTLALTAVPAHAQTGTSTTTPTQTDPAASDVLDAQGPADASGDGDIIVQGVRASLAKSLEAKRQADSIVDVITAEDIGKFPDANVAETLQRVPGVSIDRQAGEGRFASINGLGPEFVSVLVNGRVIANDNPDRSFSFDTLASELVSTVKVYKTANAVVPEGGIAGSIDVITARPFDYKGLTLSAKIGGLYEENSGKVSPQGSFLISQRFLDGRLGVLASFNYFERRNRTYRAQNSAVIPNIFFDFNSYAYVEDDEADAFRMQDLERAIDDDHRRRVGGTVAVQYQATDELTLTADYIYSNFKSTTNSNSVLNYFYAVQDNSRNVRDNAGVYTTFDHALDYDASGYAFISSKRVRPVTTNALGLNAKWENGGPFSATFDLSGSRTVNDNRGLDRDYTVEALNQAGFLVVTPPGGVPSLQGPNLYVPSQTNVNALRARITSDSGTYVKAENWQARADFKYAPEDALFVNFGASYASQRKQNEFWQTPNAVRRLYQSNAQGEQIDTDSIITGIIRPDPGLFGNADLNSDMFIVDGDALRAWMADPVNIANRTKNPTAGGLQEFIANGRSWKAVKSGDSYVVLEQVTSAYADLHGQTSLLGRPLEIVGGLRFTHTHLTSSGTTRIVTGFDDSDPTGILAPIYASADLQAVSVKHDYSNLLPSVNTKWDLPYNMVLRLSASKTLTRPILEDLAPSFNVGAVFEVRRNATAGNVQLRPFTSVNLDASYEWYYGKGSGISLSYFHKSIDDYIVNTVQQETVASVTQPQYQTFFVSRPTNAESAKINGFTASWLQTFDFGLGFQANYTKVSGSLTTDSNSGRGSALPGISDTANLVGFFENDLVGLRVAYNWRDKFLAQPNYGGYVNSPRYYRPFSQIDARLSVNLPASISLALDVVNLTDKKVRSYGVSEGAFISYQDYGRRWTLTASRRF